MGVRVRRHSDGSYWIPRPDRTMEKALDREHIRVPGSLRWFAKGYNKKLEDYRDKHSGSTCYMLGKGPSLDYLKASDMETGPIICVNDSIKQVNTLDVKNPVYVIQQDATLQESCCPRNYSNILIVSKQSRGWYSDYLNRVVVEAQALGVTAAGPTVILSIHIAKLLGCKKIIFVAFDAATNEECEYAKIIKTPATRGGDPKRFLTHRQKMLKAIDELKLEADWLTPVEGVGGTPQPSLSHPPSPDGFSLSAHSVDLQGTEVKPSETESSHSADQPDHSKKEQ